VFDRRPRQEQDRYFVGDAFVPQGVWADGQACRYTMTEYQGTEQRSFRATLRVLQANDTADDRSGSKQFDWILNGRIGRTIFHERYVLSPLVGFVD